MGTQSSNSPAQTEGHAADKRLTSLFLSLASSISILFDLFASALTSILDVVKYFSSGIVEREERTTFIPIYCKSTIKMCPCVSVRSFCWNKIVFIGIISIYAQLSDVTEHFSTLMLA